MAIEESSIETVLIRSVLTCESRRGVCAKCYGRNLANGKPVDLGEAVGVIAGQSIGEPGTQLTLRTFHIGGTAARITEQSKVMAKSEGKIVFKQIKSVHFGDTIIVLNRNGEMFIEDEEGRVRSRYNVPFAARLLVKDGQKVDKETELFEWDPYSNYILADKTGTIRFDDIIENVTFREELDESTGLRQRVIVEQREKMRHPKIYIQSDAGKSLVNYSIPTGANLEVHNGDKVHAGHILVKIPREIAKTRDITGGQAKGSSRGHRDRRNSVVRKIRPRFSTGDRHRR
jgi:DNA-directed RNA polymerase subunit beta'